MQYINLARIANTNLIKMIYTLNNDINIIRIDKSVIADLIPAVIEKIRDDSIVERLLNLTIDGNSIDNNLNAIRLKMDNNALIILGELSEKALSITQAIPRETKLRDRLLDVMRIYNTSSKYDKLLYKKGSKIYCRNVSHPEDNE